MEAQKPKIFVHSLLSGILVGLISATPYLSTLNCCCLWFVLGGFWTVYMIWHETKSVSMGTAIGAGFLTGVFAAVTYSILSTILFSLSLDTTIVQMQQMFSQSSQEIPPEFLDTIETLAKSPLVTFLVTLTFGLMVFPLGSMLGGLMAGLVFKNRA